MTAAKDAYSKALDDLTAAVAALAEAMALKNWSRDPAANWKLRGVRAVPLPPTGDQPTVDLVVAALREVIEPRERPLMPSPFGTVVQPDREATVEPSPAPAA